MSTTRITAAEGDRLTVKIEKQVEKTKPNIKIETFLVDGVVRVRELAGEPIRTMEWEAETIVGPFASETRDFDIEPGMRLVIEAVGPDKPKQGRKVAE